MISSSAISYLHGGISGQVRIEPLSGQDYSRIDGGGMPVDIRDLNLTRPADRYWPENLDDDVNLLGSD